MLTDEATGLPYIVCHERHKPLYRHPPCEICGTSNWTYRPVLDMPCGICHPARRERNDNEEVA